MTYRKEKQRFEARFSQEPKEIIAVFSDVGGSAAKSPKSVWEASMHFLAYVDAATGEMTRGEGSINWPLPDEYAEARNPYDYLARFKEGGIYRLRVRQLAADQAIDPDVRARCFLLVEMLEENVQNDALLAVQAEYRTSVFIDDPALGKFKLDKDLKLFEGEIDWLGKKISVALSVNPDDRATWATSMNVLKKLHSEQTQWDARFRAFAADELTGLANDWAQEADAPVTPQDFSKRISLYELSVHNYKEGFNAWYNDDDMFGGHVIIVNGSIEDGLESAEIAG